MNTTVATIERVDNRAMPQTQCPDVQPPPNVTPTPAIKPPMIMAVLETGTSTGTDWPRTNQKRAGVLTIPAKRRARQPLWLRDVGIRKPAKMPVAPMTRPKFAINRTEASPIKMPPQGRREV